MSYFFSMSFLKTKKGLKIPVKGHNHKFLPLIFLNLGHLERHIPLNDMWF